MSRGIFTFILRTKTNIKCSCIFDTSASLVLRVLSKRPKFKDEWDEMEYDDFYSYDIESSKDTFEKIKNGEIVLDVDDYSVDSSNTSWVRED